MIDLDVLSHPDCPLSGAGETWAEYELRVLAWMAVQPPSDDAWLVAFVNGTVH